MTNESSHADEEASEEPVAILVRDWPERLDGAPDYRYPWASALEREFARTWPTLDVQPAECPHCHRSWTRTPLEKVRLVNADLAGEQFVGFARCARAGCWGKSAVLLTGTGWILWPVMETPRDRERAGIPVSPTETATFEAESRLELANAERETAARVEIAAEKIVAVAAEFQDPDADNEQRSTADMEGKVVRRVLSSSARRDLVRLRKNPDV